MCIGCWIGYGCPTLSNETTRDLAERIRNANAYGALHIVVDDWNLEDDHIQMCLDDPQLTPDELQLCRDLLAVDEGWRAAAMAMADGFTEGFDPDV